MALSYESSGDGNTVCIKTVLPLYLQENSWEVLNKMVTVSWLMMPGTEIFIRVFGITAVGWMFSVFFDDMRKLRGMILLSHTSKKTPSSK